MTVERFLTAEELGEVLGLSRTTIWRMTKRGLPSYQFAKGSRRYRASECVAWLCGGGSVGSNVVPLRPRARA